MNPFSRKKQILSLAANGVVFLSVLVIAYFGIRYGASGGQNGSNIIGLGYFKPFTMDSNLAAGLSSLILCIFNIKSLSAGRDLTPRWVMNLYLMTATALALTFVISALFLAPMRVMGGESYFVMFRDDLFFFHFLNPVLAMLSFAFLHKNYYYNLKNTLWGIVPALIYSIVYLVMVVILKEWSDFYNFTFGGRLALVPFVMLAIYAISFALSLLLTALHNRSVKKS